MFHLTLILKACIKWKQEYKTDSLLHNVEKKSSKLKDIKKLDKAYKIQNK